MFVLVDLGIRKPLSLSFVPFPCPSVKLQGVTRTELILYKLNCSVDPELKRWGTNAYRCGSWLQLNIAAHAMLICIFEKKSVLGPPTVHMLLQWVLSVHKQML